MLQIWTVSTPWSFEVGIRLVFSLGKTDPKIEEEESGTWKSPTPNISLLHKSGFCVYLHKCIKIREEKGEGDCQWPEINTRAITCIILWYSTVHLSENTQCQEFTTKSITLIKSCLFHNLQSTDSIKIFLPVQCWPLCTAITTKPFFFILTNLIHFCCKVFNHLLST